MSILALTDSAVNGTAIPEAYRKIAVKIELITPERAATDLASQPEQRKLRMHRVEAYVKARKEGQWVLTHQGIAYDEEGKLVDGQHRLKMVALSGLPTWFLVVYNLPRDTVIHVDGQLSRSPRDAIRMAGEGDFSQAVISSAKMITMLPGNVSCRYSRRDDLLRVIRRFAAGMEFADGYKKGKGVTAGVFSLIVRAYYIADRQRLDQFVQVLHDGMPVSDNVRDDSAAILYRDWLSNTNIRGKNKAEVRKYRLGQRALQLFLERLPATDLVESEKDLFPVMPNLLEDSDEVESSDC
jgi:hydrogenase maturation factor